MTEPLTDIWDNPLAVGDKVGVAFPYGNSSAYIRVGVIISKKEKDTDVWNPILKKYVSGPIQTTVEIEWDKELSGGWVPDKPTKMKDLSGRFLKLP